MHASKPRWVLTYPALRFAGLSEDQCAIAQQLPNFKQARAEALCVVLCCAVLCTGAWSNLCGPAPTPSIDCVLYHMGIQDLIKLV